MISSYQELIVWQKSFQLTLDIFKNTSNFPKSEIYGLVSQMRRVSVSIPSNIAEGYCRGHRQEYIQFLRTSLGSAAELQTQVLLAKELGFIKDADFKNLACLLEEILKMLKKMLQTLRLTPKP